jgi:hypothetical protein
MRKMTFHTPLKQVPLLPSKCWKCGGGDISGPHFALVRAESEAGKSLALLKRTWFCHRCWAFEKAPFELVPGQLVPECRA